MLEGNQCGAIVASGATTQLSLVDVTVRGTRSCLGGGFGGQGLVVQLGASLTATRIFLEQNQGSAILVNSEGAHAVLTDVHTKETYGETSGPDQGQFGERVR